jgi:hypothetical protein
MTKSLVLLRGRINASAPSPSNVTCTIFFLCHLQHHRHRPSQQVAMWMCVTPVGCCRRRAADALVAVLFAVRLLDRPSMNERDVMHYCE